MKRSQINLDPATYAKIAQVAAGLGFTQKGGPRSGEGSPVKMLEALARGELEIVSFNPPRGFFAARTLADCYDRMDEEELSLEEHRARIRLIELCITIASEYGDEVTEE